MKFTLPVIALFGSTLASRLEPRQLATVTGILSNIADAIKGLDTAIQGYTSGSADALKTASAKIGSLTSDGIQTIGGITPLTLTDATQMSSAVVALQKVLEPTMDNLIGKKEALVAAGEAATVAADLATQMKGAQALQDAIAAKLPSAAKPVADELSAQVNAPINKAITAFADVAGAAPAGGAAAGGAAAGGASAGSASSGASSGAAAGGSSSGSSGSSSSGSSAASPSSKPAMYTGAASVNKAPIFVAIALGAVVLAL